MTEGSSGKEPGLEKKPNFIGLEPSIQSGWRNRSWKYGT